MAMPRGSGSFPFGMTGKIRAILDKYLENCGDFNSGQFDEM
jgi:hypothetical protein